jgi:DNA-binding CsgD family transcriptional regulator
VIDRSLATLRSVLDGASVSRMLADGRALARSEAVNVASGIVQPTRAMPDAQACDLLTRREMDVLYLLAEQWTDQEIADRLFLSRRRVSWHVRSILAKLDATTRGEAIAKARGRGLL